jgi:NADH:ubiquinone oxidoreductase subunit 2 (subunit N)
MGFDRQLVSWFDPLRVTIDRTKAKTFESSFFIESSFIFEFSPIALNIMTFIGSMTAFFAATTGLFQNDMKKVIAYSTCSQLG